MHALLREKSALTCFKTVLFPSPPTGEFSPYAHCEKLGGFLEVKLTEVCCSALTESPRGFASGLV